MEIAEDILDVVVLWDNFAKNALGYQIVKAADSNAANISGFYGSFPIKKTDNFVISHEDYCTKPLLF
ncbi:MAG: hypothetical protein R2764_13145 [Bacteroidales bacterium]